MNIYEGRPLDTENREQKEIKAYDLLDGLGVKYLRVDHEPAMTMEVCVDIDAALGAAMCKNLFLCNRQKKLCAKIFFCATDRKRSSICFLCREISLLKPRIFLLR